MPLTDPDLWQRLQGFELDDPAAELTFSDRLARENGWPRLFALRAIMEYKKFLYLICVSNEPLTPSDQVDQVWHLHLIYTRSYWLDLCRNVLRRDVHHGPTLGGSAELGKFTDWYERSRSFYRDEFGDDPPTDLWPASAERFSALHFERVNRKRFWLIRKPVFK